MPQRLTSNAHSKCYAENNIFYGMIFAHEKNLKKNICTLLTIQEKFV
jgi:hypothetical protein